MADRICQKWFVKFHSGEFLLDDVPQLGRTVEVGSYQIEPLIKNDKCYTMWEIDEILKIPNSIKFVKMKNVSFSLWKKLNELFGQPST